MSHQPRISLRQARLALTIATAWQAMLVVFESRQDWRIVEYSAWLIPIAAAFFIIELVVMLLEACFERPCLHPDTQGLRLRCSIVVYIGSIVVFNKAAFIAAVAYAFARSIAAIFEGRAPWMVVDVTMMMSMLFYMALGQPDLFGFSAILNAMVCIVTIAIYQDDTGGAR